MNYKILCVPAVLVTFLSPAITSAQTHCIDEEQHPTGESISHIWTGQKAGYYYQVGKAIAAASKHMPDEIRIHACTSGGSTSNITALLENHADFAIVQSDVAHQFWHCENLDAQRCANQRESSRIRMVSPLFMEKAQVLLRPHLYLSSLSELRSSHCIWLGGTGSGSEPTARMLLAAAGWSREQIAASQAGCRNTPGKLEEALASLRKGDDLDAIILTRVAPSRPILDGLRSSEIQLLGLDWPTVQRMTHDGIYRETSIQRNEYPSLDQAVYTIGVQALLLTRNNADADVVRAMAELIADHQADIELHLRRNLLAEGGARGDADSDAPTMVDGEVVGPVTLTLVGSKVSESLAAYADPEAKSSLWPWSVRRGTFMRLAIILAALAAVAFFLKLLSRKGTLVRSFYRETLFVFGAVLLWTFAALWLQSIEGDLNEHFTTLWASAISLGASALAKLHVPLLSGPAPTTRDGSTLVSAFSYLVASLVTVYMLPWIKKTWPRLRPAFWGSETPQHDEAVSGEHAASESSQAPAKDPNTLTQTARA